MKGRPEVLDRLRAIGREDVGVPQPVFAEISSGIERLPRSRRRDAFGAIKATLERRGRRIEDFDVAIAAHALATGAVLVTANTDHMSRAPGLQVEDWGSGG